MKQSVVTTFLSLFLVAFVGVNYSQGQASDNRFKVQVFTEDDDADKTFASYIKRELRTLGDIDLVDKDPNYFISLNATKFTNKGGEHIGYAVSILVTEPFNPDFLETALIRFPDDSKEENGRRETNLIFLRFLTSNLVDLKYSTLAVTGVTTDSIRNMAASIVTDIDTEVLEPARVYNRERLEKDN